MEKLNKFSTDHNVCAHSQLNDQLNWIFFKIISEKFEQEISHYQDEISSIEKTSLNSAVFVSPKPVNKRIAPTLFSILFWGFFIGFLVALLTVPETPS